MRRGREGPTACSASTFRRGSRPPTPRPARPPWPSAIHVQVVDTRSVTMGLGLLVLDAAEQAAAGPTSTRWWPPRRTAFHAPASTASWTRSSTCSEGGRIGGARAPLGSLLSIKPVIVINDGEVAEESKQRTRARSLLPGRQGTGRRAARAPGRGRRCLRRHPRRAGPPRRHPERTTRWWRPSSGRSSAPTPAPAPWAWPTSWLASWPGRRRGSLSPWPDERPGRRRSRTVRSTTCPSRHRAWPPSTTRPSVRSRGHPGHRLRDSSSVVGHHHRDPVLHHPDPGLTATSPATGSGCPTSSWAALFVRHRRP